ncbi:hypothetical protein [Paenibacillus oleatilyticus]|uniref:hypothetical protein n=1 Tax=Paenibacillus oleatilyticus TaxID=2594886 RepID=UPI001C1F2C25|nr:hypothetical protein [Paenibacillus oleatilyticus]MBU7314853.1 hypothetical protein [Paenibacillus oleatilyticus]
MKKLDGRIWYGVFAYNKYNVIAQEVEGKNKAFRRWAAMYIMEHNKHRKDLHKLLERGMDHKYFLVVVDVSVDFLNSYDSGYDVEIDISKDTHLIYCRGFDTEEILYQICEELNINPEKFNTSWNVNYILE